MASKDHSNQETISGFISIIGPPNVGKSTLLNRILGTKVAIVSPKPQTTRNRILGILNGPGFQMVFIDTPGMHAPKTPLHRSMVSSARESAGEVDIIMLMIDLTRSDDPEIDIIFQNLDKFKKPVFLLINKIDKASANDILPVIDTFNKKYSLEAIIPISALRGDGVKSILDELKKRLKPGPIFFPPEMKTDQPEDFLVSEIIREKIYLNTGREIPYSSAVTVDRIEERKGGGLISIRARIHVESESQKGIIIGRKGEMIKKIGRAARFELEKIFGKQVYLELVARVEKNWSRDAKALDRLGY